MNSILMPILPICSGARGPETSCCHGLCGISGFLSQAHMALTHPAKLVVWRLLVDAVNVLLLNALLGEPCPVLLY